jgi:hypothetical protein
MLASLQAFQRDSHEKKMPNRLMTYQYDILHHTGHSIHRD